MAARLGSEKILIEAFGLPGSGKTTLIERMLAEPEWSERQVLRYKDVMLPLRGIVGRKAVLGAEFVFFRIVNGRLWSAAKAVADSLDYATHLIRRHKMRLLKECFFIQRTLLRKCQREVVVLDQGPIQAAWHLVCYSTKVDARAFNQLLRQMKPWNAEYSLLVSTSAEQAASRVKARGGHDCPFDLMAAQDVMRAFRQHARLFDSLLPHALQENGSSVVRFPQYAEREQTFHTAQMHLAQLLRQSS